VVPDDGVPTQRCSCCPCRGAEKAWLGAIRLFDSVARPRDRRSVVGVGSKGFGGVWSRASSTPSTPWRSILGGSPGRFRAVSGSSAPVPGLREPKQGTSGHFHTSSTGRALPFAQRRRWTGSTVIFVVALLDFNTPDQQL